MRELRCAAETAVMRIERAAEARGRRVQELLRQAAVARRRDLRRRQMLRQLRRLRGQLRPPIAPRGGHRLKDLVEPRHSAAGGLRPIGAAIKRLQVGREKDRHRPAAATRHHLHGVHVDLIEIGPLLAIDLDRHEALVQQPRDPRILETLVLHHVTPVASRVADRKKNRLLLRFRPAQRLRSPRIPIHRIVLVLEQIGASFCGQTVRHRQTP